MDDQQISILKTSILEVANDNDSVIYAFDHELHAKILMENLIKMQKNEIKKEHSLTNIKVRGFDGLAIPFHAVVLATCSNTIKDLLSKNFDCYNGELVVPDIGSAGVSVLRDFAYGHDVTITSSNVEEVVKIAKLYNIDDLQSLCEIYSNEASNRNGWMNKHQKSFAIRANGILVRLCHMWQADELTDVELQDEEQETRLCCHLSCIAAASPYFRKMCAVAEGLSSMPLKGLSGKALNSLVGYIYTAKLTVDNDTAGDLFVSSLKFLLPDVTKAVCHWLEGACNHNNAVGILELAGLVQSDLQCVNCLRENTKQFIVQNFADIVEKSDEFVTMSLGNLEEVITQNELSVESEEDVFNAVMLWVRHEEDKRATFLPDLLGCVRLEYTRSDFLKTMLKQPLIQNCPSCVKMIEEAMALHDVSQIGSVPSLNESFSPTSVFDDSHSKEDEYHEDDNWADVEDDDDDEESDKNDDVDDDDDDDEWVDDDGDDRWVEEYPLKQGSSKERKLVTQTSRTPEHNLQENQGNSKKVAKKLNFEDAIPRRNNGQPDMRFKVNRSKFLEPGLNKDKSMDKRKKAFKNLKDQGLVPSDRKEKVFVPLTKDGKLDKRFKVNKEILRQELVKTNPSRPAEPGPKSKKKDGNPDMRFAIRKVPLKKNGTPDRRYAVNKGYGGTPSFFSSDISCSGVIAPSLTPRGPLKKDGTPDKRYAVNKGYSGSLFSVSSASGSSNVSGPSFISSSVPLKKDGTPDKRYAVNKGYSGSLSSVFSASGSSNVSGPSFISSSGPLKKDGTPDMRYKANRR